MRTKHPILRRDISRRQSRIERFRRCLCSVCDAGSQTVSALKGDVPGGSLERLGEPSRYLTVVWNASMSEPRHPLCEGYYTRLVGLRRSLASHHNASTLTDHEPNDVGIFSMQRHEVDQQHGAGAGLKGRL